MIATRRKTQRQRGDSADEQAALDGGRMVVPRGWRHLALVFDEWLVHRSGGQLGSGQSRWRDE
jgi:hypothetical protein